MIRRLVLGDSLEALIDHRGKTPLKLGSEFTGQGIPVASANLVRSGRLDLTAARRVDEATFRRWMGVPTKRGDVILTSEAPLGRVARVESDAPLVLGQRVFGLRGRPGVLDSRYLYYVLQTVRVQSDLLGRSTGTTVFGIRQSALREVVIPAPGYEEQCGIGEVLGALDDMIVANDQIGTTALGLARATFSRSMRELRSVPTTLGELSARGWLHMGDGYRTKRSEHGRPGLRILRAGDVQFDSLSPSGDDCVSSEFRRAIGGKASELGDIVMTTKGTVGRVAVVPGGLEKMVYSPQLCYFRVVNQDHLVPGFLSAWFRSDDLKVQAEPRMFKSDMAPYINLKDIASLVVPMVSVAEQRRIGDVQSALEQMAHAAARENEVLARTRDDLLPLLMSGKIRVRDTEKLVEGVV